MTIIHLLDDPWAPHPVVNKHICYGNSGSGGGTPKVPDYSQYISAMSAVGNELTGYGRELYQWAKQAGIDVSAIAKVVGDRAGELATEAKGTYSDMMSKWKDTYGDLYEAQAADAKRMIGELPQTEEQYAGKYSADVAQAFDASREASERSLRSYGLKAPGSGAQRLDQMVSNQRGLGQVAAAEQGRLAARNEARTVAGQAIQAGLAFPQVAGQSASTALAAGNQQIGAPESAISTTAAAYQPYLASFNSAQPWMKAWGDTMSNQYNQNLARSKAESEGGGSSGIGSMLGGLAGTVAGSFLGPVGGAVGSKVGSMIGGGVEGAASGSGFSFEEGGPVPNMVDPSMSESQGAITDDVPARLNVGEFVFPQDVVAWRGEAWMQKEIMKARKEREQNTVAEAEMAPAGAIDMRAPTFQSAEAPL